MSSRKVIQLNAGKGKRSIEKNVLENLVKSLHRKKSTVDIVASNGSDMSPNDVSQYLNVLDTFSLPNFEYDADEQSFRRYFLLTSCRDTMNWISTAQLKQKQYKERYEILKQRTLRNPSFRKPTFEAEKRSYFQVMCYKLDHSYQKLERKTIWSISFVWYAH
jgi:hypothetical protein